MVAAALEFSLGLQVNKFLEGIGLSATKLISLSSVAETLGKVMDGVWAQIEKGAALNDLSKRTGESVATLYQLQKAFTAAGVPADSIGTTLFQMQKALGGVSESGEDTNETFKKLGLNLHDLKQMDSGQALKKIMAGLAKQDTNTAAKSASTVFGRSGAADAIQMARSLDEFNTAFDKSAAQAAVFARVAEAFDDVEKAIARVKDKLAPLFLAIAEGVLPALQAVVGWIDSIDLAPIAKAIHDTSRIITEAFKEGKLLELMAATWDASIEYLGNLIFAVLGSNDFWGGIWDIMVGSFSVAFVGVLKLLMNIGLVLKAALDTAFQQFLEAIGKTKAGEWLGIKDNKAATFGENFAAARDDAKGANSMLNGWMGEGAARTSAGATATKNAIASASAASGGPAQDRMASLVAQLQANLAPEETTAPGPKSAYGNSTLTLLYKAGCLYSSSGCQLHP